MNHSTQMVTFCHFVLLGIFWACLRSFESVIAANIASEKHFPRLINTQHFFCSEGVLKRSWSAYCRSVRNGYHGTINRNASRV